MFTNIVSVIQTSMVESWSGFGNIVVNILIALILAILLIIFTHFIARIIKKILEIIRIDTLFEKLGVHHWFALRDLSFSLPNLVHWIVKWTGFIGSFIFFVRILNLQTALIYMKAVGGFVVKGFTAAIILLIGFFVANFMKQLVFGLAKALKVEGAFGTWVSGFIKWGIIIFTFIFSLSEFQISESVFKSLLTAFLAMVALAGGIALGMSGKSWADRMIEKMRKDVEQ